MLDLLRRGVKTWVAKALFALLVVSFAVWGIGDVFSGGLSSSVATVGERKIPAERFASALERETRTMAQRFGQPLDREMTQALGIPQRVLAGLAQEATLDEAVADLRVSAPDEAVRDAILADPSFLSASGGFDQAQYRYLLAQNGYSVEAYEALTRRALARDQFVRALTDGAAAPAPLVDALYRHQTEQRRVAFVTLGADQAGEIAAPDEAALAAHHEANAERYTAPETRDAVFLHVSLEAAGAGFEPDEAELRSMYEARKAEFDRPERRRLFQIVYDDRAAAEAALAKVEGGASFEDLLAERRETRADVDLGFVTKDEVAAATGEAAFALAAPGVAGPVDTGFGHALVEVAEIVPAETTAFDEAREMLAATLRRDHAIDRAPELAGEIEDRRAAGATLEEIAAELSLPLGSVTGVAADGTGATGFAADRAFLAELFAAEEGEERDFVETAAGEYFVLRVEAVKEAALRPLDEVRAEVEADWRAARTVEALEAKAEALVARIEGGEQLADIAAELGLEPETEGPKTRVQGWASLPPALVETIFRAEEGGAAFAPAETEEPAVIVAALVSIAPGEASEANAALRQSLERQMNQMAASDALTLFIAAKQAELGVTVNDAVIDAVMTSMPGG